MVSKTRLTRIEERIRQDLSEILVMESSDPRLKGLTVTGVEVDRELAFADIYVCSIEGSGRSQEVVNGLDHAQGYLRSQLAHRLDLRVIPKLRFHWDPTLEHADKIDQLINAIHLEGDVNQSKPKKRRVGKKDGSKS